MKSNAKNHNALHLVTVTMALFVAMPTLAAPVSAVPSDLPALQGGEPPEEPLRTQIRLVGDPEGEWAIELTGTTEWDAHATSLEVWSPDGRARLASGEDALRGRNLTTGKVWEAFTFDAIEDGVAQVRLSMEVDGGDAYGLNNDYHLYFYRIYDEDAPDPGEGLNLATLVADALEEAGEDPTALPDRADTFYAWGAYGVAIDDMRGRCCNFSAMPDPPIGNAIPATFIATDGETVPDLPPEIHGAVELVGAVEAFLPGEVRPSRIVEETGNGTLTAPMAGSGGTGGGSGGGIEFKDPNPGNYDDSSNGNGRTVLITGYIYLLEPAGTARACSYCSIDYYESDGSKRHDYLGSGSADAGGYFVKGVHIADGESAIDPYVQVGLTGIQVTVADEVGRVYYYNPGQAQKVNCSDTTCSIGAIYVNRYSPTGSYGYEELDKDDWDKGAMAYWWTSQAYGRFGSSIPNVQEIAVVRTPSEKPGTLADGAHNKKSAHYDPVTREIHLGSDQATTPNTVAHEYGHRLMHDIYGALPSNDCPIEHSVNTASTPQCAWIEGWANFWSIHGLYPTTRYYEGNSVSKTNYYFVDGTWFDLETLEDNCCGAAFEEGGDVEGHVAAALWDLVDSNNDGEGVNLATETHIIPVMQHDASSTNGVQITVRAFYDDWRDYYGAGSTRATEFRTAADHNTIDTTGWPT